jgi:hypothetical protein
MNRTNKQNTRKLYQRHSKEVNAETEFKSFKKRPDQLHISTHCSHPKDLLREMLLSAGQLTMPEAYVNSKSTHLMLATTCNRGTSVPIGYDRSALNAFWLNMYLQQLIEIDTDLSALGSTIAHSINIPQHFNSSSFLKKKVNL